ncbi:MAG: zinc metallopeptidase [Eubacteriales bacterium]|nr:zinc metallopeptidase [Sarcina sp.]MBR2728388.1 zinc metallopeptidase [Lachnospiraceae bacterium]MDO4417598.1 zinc metallopeptidase [Eubacteriales bacterium]
MYYYGGYGMYNGTYLLVIIGALLCLLASARVKSTYRKFAGVRSACGMTGAQAAEMILRRNGVIGVQVQHVAGELTDHYDPARGVVNLSDATYNSTSVAAIGVAAHECGHVMQHETGYLPLRLRTALVPVANIGSNFGIWIVMLGLIFGLNDTLAMIGVYLFSFGVLFQLVTLPVEFDASRRALVMLQDYGILGQSEVQGSRKVLSAAALTYVASAAASVLQLLRLLLLVNGGRRRR